MKTNNAIDAGNYIINALYDGLSAKASGTEIVSSEGPFRKMKSAEKDKVAATYVYLLAQRQHENNPLYNASAPSEAMDPKFFNILKKNWTESDLMDDNADVAQTKAMLATLSNVYHAVRKALDVKNVTATPTNIPTDDELTVHTAIEAILSQLPAASPFASQGDLDEHHAVIAPMLNNNYKCSEPAELEALTNYWQKLKASETTIKNGGLKLPNWPQLPATTAERADLFKSEIARVKGSIHRQTVNVIQASQNAQATEIPRPEPEAVEPESEPATPAPELEEELQEELQSASARPKSSASAVPTQSEFLAELKEALNKRANSTAVHESDEEGETDNTDEAVSIASQRVAPAPDSDDEPKEDLSDPAVTAASIAKMVHETAAQTPLTFVMPQKRQKPIQPFDGPLPQTFVMPQKASPTKPASHFSTQVLHSRPTIINKHGDE